MACQGVSIVIMLKWDKQYVLLAYFAGKKDGKYHTDILYLVQNCTMTI